MPRFRDGIQVDCLDEQHRTSCRRCGYLACFREIQEVDIGVGVQVTDLGYTCEHCGFVDSIYYGAHPVLTNDRGVPLDTTVKKRVFENLVQAPGAQDPWTFPYGLMLDQFGHPLLLTETEFSNAFGWPTKAVVLGKQLGCLHTTASGLILQPRDLAAAEAPVRAALSMVPGEGAFKEWQSWQEAHWSLGQAAAATFCPKLYGALGQPMHKAGAVLEATLPAPGKISFATAIGRGREGTL